LILSILEWLGFLVLDFILALIVIALYLELKGKYFRILLQRPVNTQWFGILPDHFNPAPMWVTRIRGPFPLPSALADYGLISLKAGDIILRGRPHRAAYQSLSFYPNTRPRLGSAAPSVMEFEDLMLEEDGSYIIHICKQKDQDIKNWLDSKSNRGGMLVLRSYRPEPGTKIEYPSVELEGKLVQDKRSFVFMESIQ
jgi:hypothetical protein